MPQVDNPSLAKPVIVLGTGPFRMYLGRIQDLRFHEVS